MLSQMHTGSGQSQLHLAMLFLCFYPGLELRPSLPETSLSPAGLLGKCASSLCFKDDKRSTVILALDPTAIAVPGYLLRGNSFIRLPLQGTKLDISPLLVADDRLATPVRSLGLQAMMELADLLWRLDAEGRKMQWLYQQLVHALAHQMELTLLEEVSILQASDSSASAPLPPESLLLQRGDLSRRPASRKQQQLLRMNRLNMTTGTRQLLKYMLALREHFQSEQVLHVSFDASRVGGKNRLLGFMTRPDGIGGWCPPQVWSLAAWGLCWCVFSPKHKEFWEAYFCLQT